MRAKRAWLIQPGDRVTFGNHTGYYRVRRVEFNLNTVTIWSWFRRRVTISADAWAWCSR